MTGQMKILPVRTVGESVNIPSVKTLIFFIPETYIWQRFEYQRISENVSKCFDSTRRKLHLIAKFKFYYQFVNGLGDWGSITG